MESIYAIITGLAQNVVKDLEKTLLESGGPAGMAFTGVMGSVHRIKAYIVLAQDVASFTYRLNRVKAFVDDVLRNPAYDTLELCTLEDLINMINKVQIWVVRDVAMNRMNKLYQATDIATAHENVEQDWWTLNLERATRQIYQCLAVTQAELLTKWASRAEDRIARLEQKVDGGGASAIIPANERIRRSVWRDDSRCLTTRDREGLRNGTWDACPDLEDRLVGFDVDDALEVINKSKAEVLREPCSAGDNCENMRRARRLSAGLPDVFYQKLREIVDDAKAGGGAAPPQAMRNAWVSDLSQTLVYEPVTATWTISAIAKFASLMKQEEVGEFVDASDIDASGIDASVWEKLQRYAAAEDEKEEKEEEFMDAPTLDPVVIKGRKVSAAAA